MSKKSGREALKQLLGEDARDEAPPAPPIDEEAPPADDQPPDGEVMQLPVGTKITRFTRTVSVPLGHVPPEAFVSRHADTKLNHAQAMTMRQVTEGLMDAGARLANGRRVKTPADAVRYLLEQLAVPQVSDAAGTR